MPATAPADKIDVKAAAKIAFDYLRDLMPGIPGEDISLEEVEAAGKTWLVTLGFTDRHLKSIAALARGDARAYKQFTIDATTGAVLSMHIRKP